MSLSDPIADMLTRIRNALMIKSKTCTVKASKVCINIARVLKEEGYIEDYDIIDDGKQGLVRIKLKYDPLTGEPVIRQLKRESKPGRRVYTGVKNIPRVLEGLGVAILSTDKGVLSDREAREKHVGGELICTIY